MNDLLNKAGGRKFFTALAVIACAMIAADQKWINGAQLTDTLKNVLLLYGAANVGSKAVDTIKAIAQKLGVTASTVAETPKGS
jgi:hypothetical protein